MKNYEKPEIEVVSIEVEENVTISGGVGTGGRPGRTSLDDEEY